MRNVSTNFIEASLSPIGYANAYIEIGDTRIDASNITDITITSDICEGGSYTIGSFTTAEASMTIVSDALPNVVTATPIRIYFGYYIASTGEFEYVPMGVFYAEPRDVSHKNLLTTIKAHDMSWAMVDQFISSLTYPTTVANVLTEIQTALNLTFGAYGGLAPSSVTVYEAPIGSYRDVIAQMALLMGTCAKLNRSGALDFIKVMPSTPVQDYGAYDYTADNYQLTSNQPMAFGVLTVNYTHEVTTGEGEEQETEEVTDTYTYSAPSGSHGLTIDTRNIRSQAETNSLGMTVLGSGVSYYGYSAVLPGQPQIDLGDTIELTEPLGDTYEFLVLSVIHQFNGSMKSTFSAVVNDSDPQVSGGNVSGSLTEQVQTISNALGRQTRLLADTIAAKNAEIGDLRANKADIDAANIDSASIQDAWINKLMVQTGLLAKEGTIYSLDAIQVNASNITAGTIDVERLIVTVDGQKYMVHVDPATSTPTYEKLDGNIIQPLTIAADRIISHSITTEQITVEDLIGTNGWINLAEGKFFYGDGADWASSNDGIWWDGDRLRIKGSVTVTGGNTYTKSEIDEMVKETGFSVRVEIVTANYNTNTATLIARVYRGGEEVTDVSNINFKWTKDPFTAVLGTSQTLNVTDLTGTYVCELDTAWLSVMTIADGELYFDKPEDLDADFEIVDDELIATFDDTEYDFTISADGCLIMEEL